MRKKDMGDLNNKSRPLSPHLDIYQFQITWTVSIMHRATEEKK